MEKPLTQHLKPDRKALSLIDYEKVGGYQSLRKMLKELTPQQVTSIVKDSGLKGRGGAGFNTGLKWSFVPMGNDVLKPKYLIANGDEMEPGTFKDRLLLEGNPHQLIEGMICGAYAIAASEAYIFIRWAYKDAARVVQKALNEANAAGYLGKNILDSPFNLEIHLHASAGRYICGEETGLINSLEGKRANPRSKPPFPAVSGLFGKPTIVNNIETLSCVPHIISHGAEWFKSLSVSEDTGTKLYGVSGKVKNPGLWELPLGTTAREIIEEHAGGVSDGLKLRGFLPGGASTGFMIPEQLDAKMDFKGVAKAGSRLGTGTIIILDDRTCPVGFVHNLEQFFSQESCGWCTPCRDGLPWMRDILWAIETGQGEADDLNFLDKQCKLLGPGYTFCGLGPGAVEPLQSALKYFREDFFAHIQHKCCPWKV